MIASTSTVPWMNRPVLSMASEPANGTSLPFGDGVAVVSLCSSATAITAPMRPASVSPTCTQNRSGRGTTASTSTPSSAAPSTMKMGSSEWYATDGVLIAGAASKVALIYFRPPAMGPYFGVGSVLCTLLNVSLTAGLMMSSTGFG